MDRAIDTGSELTLQLLSTLSFSFYPFGKGGPKIQIGIHKNKGNGGYKKLVEENNHQEKYDNKLTRKYSVGKV